MITTHRVLHVRIKLVMLVWAATVIGGRIRIARTLGRGRAGRIWCRGIAVGRLGEKLLA